MATVRFKLVSGSSYRHPLVHFNAFKQGKNYDYDDQNPDHAFAIEQLKADSSFEYEILATPEEQAVLDEAAKRQKAEDLRAQLALLDAEIAEADAQAPTDDTDPKQPADGAPATGNPSPEAGAKAPASAPKATAAAKKA